MRTVAEAIDRIERFRPDFRYDEARAYVALVREFYAGMKARLQEAGRPLATPLVDSVPDENVRLPADVLERLDAVMSAHRDYAPTVRRICHWYLREARAGEQGLLQRSTSVYEPLIALLEKGGHFYEHHGALCLSDAATVPFIGR